MQSVSKVSKQYLIVGSNFTNSMYLVDSCSPQKYPEKQVVLPALYFKF